MIREMIKEKRVVYAREREHAVEIASARLRGPKLVRLGAGHRLYLIDGYHI